MKEGGILRAWQDPLNLCHFFTFFVNMDMARSVRFTLASGSSEQDVLISGGDFGTWEGSNAYPAIPGLPAWSFQGVTDG
jgi:hypothetical protein